MIRELTKACLVGLILSGCASAKLEITSDLYTIDPIDVRPLSQGDADALAAAVEETKTAADRIATDRKALANAAYDVFVSYRGFVAALRGIELKGNGLRRPLEAYTAYLERQRGTIDELAVAALVNIAEYRKQSQTVSGANPKARMELKGARDVALSSVNELRSHLSILAGITGIPDHAARDFDKILRHGLSAGASLAEFEDEERISKFAGAQVSPEIKNARDALISNFRDLSDQVGETATSADIAFQQLDDKIEQASKKLKSASGTKLANALASAMGAAAQFTLSDIKDQRGATVVARLGRSLSLYASQIDRLHDPADPVWRQIIAAPEDEWKNFSQTVYYAEGNTSIVIARDQVDRYRVQRARNNPAALVRSQLQVTRAVASRLEGRIYSRELSNVRGSGQITPKRAVQLAGEPGAHAAATGTTSRIDQSCAPRPAHERAHSSQGAPTDI
jgi:hypothetical protein